MLFLTFDVLQYHKQSINDSLFEWCSAVHHSIKLYVLTSLLSSVCSAITEWEYVLMTVAEYFVMTNHFLLSNPRKNSKLILMLIHVYSYSSNEYLNSTKAKAKIFVPEKKLQKVVYCTALTRTKRNVCKIYRIYTLGSIFPLVVYGLPAMQWMRH